MATLLLRNLVYNEAQSVCVSSVSSHNTLFLDGPRKAHHTFGFAAKIPNAQKKHGRLLHIIVMWDNK